MNIGTNAVIAKAIRTPFGKYNGGLSRIRPDDLLSDLMSSLVSSIPALDAEEIDEVIIGNSNGAGEDNRNVARMSLLLAGLPVTLPGLTVNRLCGSGAEALSQAARIIRGNDATCILAGGVESMSRAPWIVEKTANQPENPTFHQSTIGWRLVNEKMPAVWTTSLGLAAENVALESGISRSEQDEWSLRSHIKAKAAWDNGFHGSWVRPIGEVFIDESIRADTSVEKLQGLRSAFSETGPVTAGNSSPLNDGAVLALITSERRSEELGLEPLGRILSTQVVGVSPERFTTGPIFAVRKLLQKNGLKVEDINLWEINEAFAAMVLTVLRSFPNLDHNLVNMNGGAIAIGHPIGASAARAVIDCARGLHQIGGGLGIATACIGVGQGIAVLVEVN
jgi:acetyl-CoA acyltransferase